MSIPKPSYDSAEPISLAMSVQTGAPGPFLRRNRYRRRLRRFRLVYDRNLTAARLADLVAVYEATMGGAGSFSYTPFQAITARTVQFVGGSLRYQHHSADMFSATIELEEVPSS